MTNKGVWKRADSPYYWGCIMVNGKREHRALSKNKFEALKKLQEWRVKRKLVKGQPVTWAAFKTIYLEWAYANKSKNTAYRDRLSMEYLEEFCAGKNISLKFITDVNPRMLDDFKTYMKLKSDGGVAHNWSRKKERGVMGNVGINRTLQSLKVIMRKAEDWEYISDDIKWSKIKKFRTPRGRVEFFTTEEVSSLLTQA